MAMISCSSVESKITIGFVVVVVVVIAGILLATRGYNTYHLIKKGVVVTVEYQTGSFLNADKTILTFEDKSNVVLEGNMPDLRLGIEVSVYRNKWGQWKIKEE